MPLDRGKGGKGVLSHCDGSISPYILVASRDPLRYTSLPL